MRKIILFELNEVPSRVIEYYIDKYPGSAFSEFYYRSTCAETISPDTNWLHPWCTWPTLHRGVEAERHTIANLSQNLREIDEEYPPLWNLLSNAGVSVGLGGSLHSWPMPSNLENFKFYLPDTFAADAQAFPPELSKFQGFNLKMVDRSARNVSKGLFSRETLALIASLPKLGIGGRTMKKIVGQLADEQKDPSHRNRRRIFQGIVAFDVYFRQLCRTKPSFSTFFSNHVASSMHRYWAATFPEDFDSSEFSDAWRERYAGEIDYAMAEAADMLKKLMDFSRRNPEYIVILTTSMGQAAFSGKAISRQVYVKDPKKFMQLFSIDELSWSRRRVMLPRFAFVTDPDASEKIRALAPTLKVAGCEVLHEESAGNYHMFKFGMEDVPERDEFVTIGNQRFSFAAAGLENAMIQDESGSSGYHIPEGMFLCFDPLQEGQVIISGQVDTREICPSILQWFNIGIPKSMKNVAKSLLPS